jgi:hypothetical protein
LLLGAVILLLLAVVFVGEGSEVAVAMLMDKDPEQFSESNVRSNFKRLIAAARQSRHSTFISGRQLVVALSLVSLTLLCDHLAELISTCPESGRWQWICGIRQVFSTNPSRFLFALLFPSFVGLWLAQLPPKFLAHENPLRTFSWAVTAAVIDMSVALDRRTRLATPSVWLADLIRQRWLPPAPLGPGRRAYYETSARLRGGTGVTLFHMSVIVKSDGSIAVEEHVRYRSFGPGLSKFPQRVNWQAKIADGSHMEVSGLPQGITWGGSGPVVEEALFDGATMYSAAWTLDLTGDLPEDHEFDVKLIYTAGAGAMEHTVHASDWYAYRVKWVPHEEIVFDVRAADDAPFVLVSPRVELTIVEDEETINNAEGDRVHIGRAPSGGIRFNVLYPLLATKLKFHWSLEQKGTA